MGRKKGPWSSGHVKDRDLSKLLLTGAAAASVAIVFLIIVYIVVSSAGAVTEAGLWNVISGTEWNPMTGGSYGALPVVLGTILVTIGALAFAVPLGLTSSIFLSEIVPGRIRNILKPVCEIFAGIPSVVYGFFGLVVLVPFLMDLFPDHLSYGFSWLAASILLGVMALPTIISVSDDAMQSVPKSYREASVAMGATRWETTSKIVIPAALSGISSAVLLGLGRAIGETMAVMMVAGNSPNIPEPLWNVFEMVRTITSTLALEMGEASGTHESVLFLLALFLMIMVAAVNFAAKFTTNRIKRRFGEGGGTPKVPAFVTETIGKAKRPFILTVIFVFVLMMASLFASIALSAVIAFLCVLSVVAAPYVSRLMRPMDRQKIAHGVMASSMAIVCIILAVILFDIVSKGAPAISAEFITGMPSDMGRAGGIFPAILGTMELIAGTAAIALPLGILTGTYLSEFAKESRFTRIVRSSLDMLNGTPSIVFGLFGLVAIVSLLGGGRSLLAGCITLAFLTLPVIIRTTEETLRSVPKELREASAAMGATKWETTAKVVIPAAMGGILTGIILSLGRAAGETAPIMFTAVVVSKRYVEFSLLDPIMALPYHLYSLAAEVPNSGEAQYGTALVLMILVLGMFTLASIVRHHYSKKIRW